MRKLIITLTLTIVALAASADRVKATFTVVDDCRLPLAHAYHVALPLKADITPRTFHFALAGQI